MSPFREDDEDGGEQPRYYKKQYKKNLYKQPDGGTDGRMYGSSLLSPPVGADYLYWQQQHGSNEGRTPRPGAYREGGNTTHQDDEDDEITVDQSTASPPVGSVDPVETTTAPAVLSAYVVNESEEEQRLREMARRIAAEEMQRVAQQQQQQQQQQHPSSLITDAIPLNDSQQQQEPPQIDPRLKRRRRAYCCAVLVCLCFLIALIVVAGAMQRNLLGLQKEEKESANPQPTLPPAALPPPPSTQSPTAITTTITLTMSPTGKPSPAPTTRPTSDPSQSPTARPTNDPSPSPTPRPTGDPIQAPTPRPTPWPTGDPSQAPTPRPTGNPSQEPTPFPNCIDSLDVLYNRMQAQDPAVETNYTLCPGSQFFVGHIDDNGDCCEGGEHPIYPRSNSWIKCGDSGSRANSCTIYGGQFHVSASQENYEGMDRSVENFRMQGITMEGATNAGMVLDQPGDMTFEDCLFRGHQNALGAVTLSWTDTRRRRRRLNDRTWPSRQAPLRSTRQTKQRLALSPQIEGGMGDDDSERRRRTQLVFLEERLVVHFKDCIFDGNSQDRDAAVAQRGVITDNGGSHDIDIQGCIFRNNLFNVSPRGYAVSVIAGSTFSIRDSCLDGNDFLGSAPIVVYGDDSSYEMDNNYVEAGDDGLVCPFVAHVPSQGADPVCHDSDAMTCTYR